MNVSLGEKWENFVNKKVKSGDFQTSSEVLREGLRLMEEKDLLKRISVSSLAELEQKLLEGVASLDRGEGIDGEEAFKRLRARAKERKGMNGDAVFWNCTEIASVMIRELSFSTPGVAILLLT